MEYAVGQVVLFASVAYIPNGFLPCDGSTYPISSYPDLYQVLGPPFNTPGSTFLVPFIPAVNNTKSDGSFLPPFFYYICAVGVLSISNGY